MLSLPDFVTLALMFNRQTLMADHDNRSAAYYLLVLLIFMLVSITYGSFLNFSCSSHKVLFMEPNYNSLMEDILQATLTLTFSSFSNANFDLVHRASPNTTVLNSSGCSFMEDHVAETLSQYSFAGDENDSCFVVISLFCESATTYAGDMGRELGIPVLSSNWKAHSDNLLADRFPTLFEFGIGSVDTISGALEAFLQSFAFVHVVLICQEDEADPFLYSSCQSSAVTFIKDPFIATLTTVPKMMDVILIDNNTCVDALTTASQFSRVTVLFLSPEYVQACMATAMGLGFSDGSYVYISIISPHQDKHLSLPKNDEIMVDKQNVYAQLFLLSLNEPFKREDLSAFASRLEQHLTMSMALLESLPSDAVFLNMSYIEQNDTLDIVNISSVFLLSRPELPKKPSNSEIFSAFLIHCILDIFVKTIASIANTSDEFGDTQNLSLVERLQQTRQQQLNYLPERSFYGLFTRLVLDGTLQTFATYDDKLPGVLTLVTDNDTFLSTWPGNKFPPPDQPVCGFSGLSSDCPTESADIWMSLIAAPVVASALVLCCAFCCCKNKKSDAEDSSNTSETTTSSTDTTNWNITPYELQPLVKLEEKPVRHKSRMSETISVISDGLKHQRKPEIFLFMNRKVWVKSRELSYSFIPEDHHIIFLRKAKRFAHPNIAHLFGIVLSTDPLVYEMKMVMEYWDRGSLHDLIWQESQEFTFALKAVLIRDIVTAMTYLHSSFIICHGSLKSPNCLISDRFTVKISDYGLNAFPIHPADVSSDEYLYYGMLWTAPEILRGPIIRIRKGSRPGDVYSFGIILQEIFSQTEPFYDFDRKSSIPPKEIVHLIIQRSPKPFRPLVPLTACDDKLYTLMTSCWAENYSERPTFKQLAQTLDHIPGFRKNATYLDYLLRKMEAYSEKLEDRVKESTAGLLEEKKKSDELLAQMMPRRVLEEMKKGQVISPESFEHVTIGFTAVIDFAAIAQASTPLEIVTFLNDIYVTFDASIEQFDVYKVETIQDSYMIASGLPERNGVEHAAQVSSLALEMLHFVKNIRIAHMNDREIEMKIGIHTGSCAAGVIGSVAARYCLFGDTINTASRMCSAGEAQKIQVSESTKLFLEENHPGRFVLTLRGETDVKIVQSFECAVSFFIFELETFICSLHPDGGQLETNVLDHAPEHEPVMRFASHLNRAKSFNYKPVLSVTKTLIMCGTGL